MKIYSFNIFPLKKKLITITKTNKRLDEVIRMRNAIVKDNVTSVDTVEKVICGGIFSEVFEGFFCHNLEYTPYTEFVPDMFEVRDLSKSQKKDLLQNLAKKTGLSVYGGSVRKDINEEYKCVTETWMRENFDDMVKEWFPLRNVNLIVKIRS